MFEDAIKTANFRVNGNEEIPLDRISMFRLNFNTYFFAKGHKPAVLLLTVLMVLIILLVFNHKKDWKTAFVPYFLVAAFPYVWYLVFANHSQLHYFYTYRIQAITLFALIAWLSDAIDWKNVNNPAP